MFRKNTIGLWCLAAALLAGGLAESRAQLAPRKADPVGNHLRSAKGAARTDTRRQKLLRAALRFARVP